MAKNTAIKDLRKRVKDLIPAAGTDQEKLTLQRVYSDLLYRIDTEYLSLEKEQLREAFERGAVYSSILHMKAVDMGNLDDAFDKYYNSNHGE